MKKKEWIVLVLLIILDQASKLYIASKLTLGASIQVIKNFFYITYVTNSGAAWSMFSNLTMRWIFVFLALAVTVYLGWYLINKGGRPVMRWSIVLIMAGSIGNMLDRIISGKVTDFFNFFIFGYDFPVFNVADCALTIGTILLVIQILFFEDKKHASN
jgi:signal peptidase II